MQLIWMHRFANSRRSLSEHVCGRTLNLLKCSVVTVMAIMEHRVPLFTVLNRHSRHRETLRLLCFSIAGMWVYVWPFLVAVFWSFIYLMRILLIFCVFVSAYIMLSSPLTWESIKTLQ